MKLSAYLISLLLLLFLSACCKSDSIDLPDNNNIPGLPPATQSGANTLGFLLNSVPWTPEGNNGTANLSLDFDPGIDHGIFSIAAYKVVSANDVVYFGIGLRDSLNYMLAPQTFIIGANTLAGVFYSRGFCMLDYFSSDIYRKGLLTINKLDKTNRIIAGTFEATLYRNGCDTIKITNGRFDLKF